MIKKVLKESISSPRKFELIPTGGCIITTWMDKLLEYDLAVYSKFKGFLLPWDSYVDIEDGFLVLDGYAGPSGQGSAVVKIPLKDASNYVTMTITLPSYVDASQLPISDIENESGWIIKPIS